MNLETTGTVAPTGGDVTHAEDSSLPVAWGVRENTIYRKNMAGQVSSDSSEVFATTNNNNSSSSPRQFSPVDVMSMANALSRINERREANEMGLGEVVAVGGGGEGEIFLGQKPQNVNKMTKYAMEAMRKDIQQSEVEVARLISELQAKSEELMEKRQLFAQFCAQ